MNIEHIREELIEHKNKKHHFKYTGSRNHVEEFNGKIRSFTYNDVAMKSLKIMDK